MFEEVTRVVPDRVRVVAEAYDDHQRDLFSFAFAIVRDREEADDVVQETFARLVREVAAGRPPRQVRPWLFTVCTNIARSRLRRQRVAGRWLHLFGQGPHDAGDDTEGSILRREAHGELHRALAALPADQRVVLLLAAQGFGGEEIAAVIGRSHGATRNLLWRARTALRARLGEDPT